MSVQTIGGLFADQDRGEKALAELHAAKFGSAQISEVAGVEDVSLVPAKLTNPATDFFADHTVTGADFRTNLTELGMSAADAQYFADGVAGGGALVTVKADGRAAEAIEILQRHGADLASQTVEGNAAPATLGAAPSLDADQTIQLRAERLELDKMRVASGTVRVRKDVITQQHDVDVPVSHEELVIERHAVVDGAIGGTIGDEKTISVPLSREEIVVSKQTYVTEEIDIGKRAVTDTQHVSETVRHEELVVDAPVPTTATHS